MLAPEVAIRILFLRVWIEEEKMLLLVEFFIDELLAMVSLRDFIVWLSWMVKLSFWLILSALTKLVKFCCFNPSVWQT